MNRRDFMRLCVGVPLTGFAGALLPSPALQGIPFLEAAHYSSLSLDGLDDDWRKAEMEGALFWAMARAGGES